MGASAGSRRRLLFLGGLAVLLGQCVAAENISLDQLTSCGSVDAALESIKRQAIDCEAPGGTIESALQTVIEQAGEKACLLSNAPTAQLAQFRCVQSSGPKGRGLTCFRPVSLAVLNDFKTEYGEKYAVGAQRYVFRSARCSASNGESAKAQPEMFPPVLMSVARPEFGFIVQYGKGKPAGALGLHGFARTSPTIARSGPAAIEYVSFTNALLLKEPPTTAIGGWRLHIDTSPEFLKPFLSVVAKGVGIDAVGEMFEIDMRRAPDAPDFAKQPPISDALSDMAVSRLKEEGFKEMRDSEFKTRTGKTKKQFIDVIMSKVAFGAQGMMRGKILDVRLLLKEKGLECTDDGEGALGAYIITFIGAEDDMDNHGSFSLLVVGFGECASSSGSSRTYMRKLSAEIKDATLAALRRR